jgi:hypothetical protein
MLHSIQRLRGVRMAIVLVEPRQLGWDVAGPLLSELQAKFQLPAMLVARDNTAWNNARSVAEFDSVPYLLEFLALGDVEWTEAKFAEPELPF